MSDDTAPTGTFACPICGKETPHGHSPEVVRAYEKTRSNSKRHEPTPYDTPVTPPAEETKP